MTRDELTSVLDLHAKLLNAHMTLDAIREILGVEKSVRLVDAIATQRTMVMEQAKTIGRLQERCAELERRERERDPIDGTRRGDK